VSDESSETPLAKHRSFFLGAGLLGAILLLTAILAGVVVSKSYGMVGLYACLCAFAVCWISSSLALALTLFTSGGIQAVSGMFLAMGVRTALPLGFGVLMNLVGGPLVEAGLFGLIVIHYLVGLLAETTIAVKILSTYNLGTSAN